MLGIGITVVLIQNLARIAATIYQIKVQVLGEVKDELLEVQKFVESELARRARRLRGEARDVLVQHLEVAKADQASLRGEVDERLQRLEQRFDALASTLGENAGPDRSLSGPGTLAAAANPESGTGGASDRRTS